MGKTFYTETEEGSTVFRTERKIGDVRIPNYVYDIWESIIGAVGMGVYGTYCRLERNDAVTGLNQAKIAGVCRIGTKKLAEINDQLVECGFIRIRKPEGHQRLMHYTTEITVLDPPQEVSKAIKDKYAPPSGYQILTPWLQADTTEKLGNNADDANQQHDALPDDNANVAALGLQPLEVEPPTPNGAGQEKESPQLDCAGISRALRGTLTHGENDPVQRSDLAEYIGQQFNSPVPPGQCNDLALPYTEQLLGGKKRKHPSPDELWSTHSRFSEWVGERIAYVKGKGGSPAQQRAKAVNAVCQYKGTAYSWLEWLERQQKDSPVAGFKMVERPPRE